MMSPNSETEPLKWPKKASSTMTMLHPNELLIKGAQWKFSNNQDVGKI